MSDGKEKLDTFRDKRDEGMGAKTLKESWRGWFLSIRSPQALAAVVRPFKALFHVGRIHTHYA